MPRGCRQPCPRGAQFTLPARNLAIIANAALLTCPEADHYRQNNPPSILHRAQCPVARKTRNHRCIGHSVSSNYLTWGQTGRTPIFLSQSERSAPHSYEQLLQLRRGAPRLALFEKWPICTVG